MALQAGAASTASVQRALARQVVGMYRAMCRDVPKVLVMYNLEQTPSEARHMLLLHYRKASAAVPNDPRIVEMLLERARQEYEETMQQWKQKGHLMAILQPELAAPDVWTDEEEFFRRCAPLFGGGGGGGGVCCGPGECASTLLGRSGCLGRREGGGGG